MLEASHLFFQGFFLVSQLCGSLDRKCRAERACGTRGGGEIDGWRKCDFLVGTCTIQHHQRESCVALNQQRDVRSAR